MSNERNLIQVFSKASMIVGANSAFEIAKYIKEKGISNYFPLSNIGSSMDILEQEDAAEKYGLIPVYGRTFSFLRESEMSNEVPVTIYARNMEGRDWIYQQPSVFSDSDSLVSSLSNSPKNGVLVFISVFWLLSDELKRSVGQIRRMLGSHVFTVVNNAIEHNYKKEVMRLHRVVGYTPVCGVGEDESDIRTLLVANLENEKKLQSLFLSPKEKTQLALDLKIKLAKKLSFKLLLNNEKTSKESAITDILFSGFEKIPTLKEQMKNHNSICRDIDPNEMNPTSEGCESISELVGKNLSDFFKMKGIYSEEERAYYQHQLNVELNAMTRVGSTLASMKVLGVRQSIKDLGATILGSNRAAVTFVNYLLGITDINPLSMYNIPLGLVSNAELLHYDFNVMSEGDRNLNVIRSHFRENKKYITPVKRNSLTPIEAIEYAFRDGEDQVSKELLFKNLSGKHKDVKRDIAYLRNASESCESGKVKTALILATLPLIEKSAFCDFVEMPIEHYKISPLTSDGCIGMTRGELNRLGLMSFSFYEKIEKTIIHKTMSELSIKEPGAEMKEDDPRAYDVINSCNTMGIDALSKNVIEIALKGHNEVSSIVELSTLIAFSMLCSDDSELSSLIHTPVPSTAFSDINKIIKSTGYNVVYNEQALHLLTDCLGVSLFKARELVLSLECGRSISDTDLFVEGAVGNFDEKSKCICVLLNRSGGKWISYLHAYTLASDAYKQAYLISRNELVYFKHYLNSKFSQYKMKKRDKLLLIRAAIVEHNVAFFGLDGIASYKNLNFDIVNGHLEPGFKKKEKTHLAFIDEMLGLKS